MISPTPWTVRVTNTTNLSLSGTEQLTITPAATASLGLATYDGRYLVPMPNTQTDAVLDGQAVNVDVVAHDQFGNINYNDNGPATLTVNGPRLSAALGLALRGRAQLLLASERSDGFAL